MREKEAKELAQKLESLQVKLEIQAGAEGRVYGSVTAKDVAEALQKTYGIEIDKRKIEMDAIKACGNYQLTVKVYPGIQAKLALTVVSK